LLLEARKEDGLQINMEEIKPAYALVFLSCHQNVGENHDTYILINNLKRWIRLNRPFLCSSGQSSWSQIQRSRVRFPALPDSTQLLEDNCGAT
jgi:hypothetical protein